MSVGDALALSAARLAARWPSLEGCVVLSGEWIRRPDRGGGTALRPYTERSCVRLFWYLWQRGLVLAVAQELVAHRTTIGAYTLSL
jgi:hypothetical protein